MYLIYTVSSDLNPGRVHVGTGLTRAQVMREPQALGLLGMNEKRPRLPKIWDATLVAMSRGKQSYSIEYPPNNEVSPCTSA